MRDLRRIHLAQRLIRLEVRTMTICAWTGLNEERVRNLARFCDAGSSRARRMRGPRFTMERFILVVLALAQGEEVELGHCARCDAALRKVSPGEQGARRLTPLDNNMVLARALLADLENDPYERQFPFVGPHPPSMRSMGRALAYVASVSFVLVACSREPSGAVQTVSYFQDHHDERQAMVARCANDSVRLAMTPNCINAVEAQANEDPGSFRKVPSMGLTQEPDVDLDDPGRPQVRPY